MPKSPEATALARRTWEHVVENKRLHSQNTWLYTPDGVYGSNLVIDLEALMSSDTLCGSTACFAGWVSIVHGDTLDPYGTVTATLEDGYDARWRHVSNRARDLLELTDNEESDLFLDATTLQEVRDALIVIFGPEVVEGIDID